MIFIVSFSQIGTTQLYLLTTLSVFAGIVGSAYVLRAKPFAPLPTLYLFRIIILLFLAGLLLIGWFHYQIYLHLPLQLSEHLTSVINGRLQSINRRSFYDFPLYDPSHPPRYVIPLWIENGKYYFWFFCSSLMAYIGYVRLEHVRLRGVLLIVMMTQSLILCFWVNPFLHPLPLFFEEYLPWINGSLNDMERLSLFMSLYSKMTFYYNAGYMWTHPPMLFLSYGAITMTFVTSVFMLFGREFEIEKMGYDFAKFGYFMLTIGMLLGYPWALKAWGPNWWWDPKICSSIMMWAIYSTFMHTRLYGNRIGMWYFTSILGILCFLAMIFTLVSSFFFPGEHTFQ